MQAARGRGAELKVSDFGLRVSGLVFLVQGLGCSFRYLALMIEVALQNKWIGRGHTQRRSDARGNPGALSTPIAPSVVGPPLATLPPSARGGFRFSIERAAVERTRHIQGYPLIRSSAPLIPYRPYDGPWGGGLSLISEVTL